MDWAPIRDRIIVKKFKDDKTTASGLILVSAEENDKNKKAEVIAVGSGKIIDGKTVPLSVKVGDTVLYNGMYGTDIGQFMTSSSNEHLILHEEDIIAIVENK